MTTSKQFQCGETWSSSSYASTSSPSTSSNQTSLRVVSFNIERGYEWRKIAQQIQNENADVVLLQEVDMCCERTGRVNVAEEMAKALKMHVVWGCEFVELASWWRSKRLAGGGSHGNAVLARFRFANSGCIVHATKPYDWSANGWKWLQPRTGSRVFVWVDLDIGGGQLVRCYSIHFENMCGVLGRAQQMSEILEHRDNDKVYLFEVNCRSCFLVVCSFVLLIIQFKGSTILAGDFNTLAHGTARFLPMSIDGMTLKTFGYSEEDVWRLCFIDDIQNDATASALQSTLFSSLSANTVAMLKTLRNFNDTVKSSTTTMNAWLFSAKLDWLLFTTEHFTSTNSVVTNQDGSLSDHCCLMVDLKIKSN